MKTARAILLLLAAILAAPSARADEQQPAPQRKELRVGALRFARGPSLEIAQGESSDGDVYAFVFDARVAGTVAGDFVGAAKSVRISGAVERDVDAAGADVDVSGEVGGRLRVAANEATLSGTVAADAIFLGTTVKVQPSAVVDGALIVNSGRVVVSGRVDGPAWISAGQVTIEGRIAGDLTVACDELTIGRGARIDGNLVYESRSPATIPPDAVAGTVTRTEKAPPPREAKEAEGGSIHFGLRVYFAFVALAAGALLIIFFRSFVDGAQKRNDDGHSLAVSFGMGLVALFSMLVLGVLCCVLLPLSLAVFAAIAALGYMGALVGKMLLGRWAFMLLRRPAPHPVLALLVGVVVVGVVGLVPYVGGLFWFVVTVTGMGACIMQLRDAGKAADEAPPPLPPAA